MEPAKSGDLMFRCPKTERDFNSGFTADQNELAVIASCPHLRMRCPECGEPHEFKFADGWLQAKAAITSTKRARS
jgi:hypothetical protein